jgi:predicted metal-binding protein
MGPTVDAQRAGRAELVACETCGHARLDEAGRVPGQVLIAELRAAHALRGGGVVDVSSVRCLWSCSRSCAVHLRAPGKLGYVIGDLPASEVSAVALLDYADLYAASEEGRVPFKQCPEPLKGHFVCRIPPAASDQYRGAPGTESEQPRSETA